MLGWFGQIGRLWVIYSKADLGWIDRGKSGSVYAASSRICTQPSPADASYPQGSSTCILEQQRRKKVEWDQMTGSWVSHFKCFFFWLAPGKYFRDLRRLCVDMIEQPCHCFVNICLIARLAFCPTGTVGNSWWKRNFCYVSVGVTLWMWTGVVNLQDYLWLCMTVCSVPKSYNNFFMKNFIHCCPGDCKPLWLDHRVCKSRSCTYKSVSGFCEWQTHSGTPYTLESKVWKLLRLFFYI